MKREREIEEGERESELEKDKKDTCLSVLGCFNNVKAERLPLSSPPRDGH